MCSSKRTGVSSLSDSSRLTEYSTRNGFKFRFRCRKDICKYVTVTRVIRSGVIILTDTQVLEGCGCVTPELERAVVVISGLRTVCARSTATTGDSASHCYPVLLLQSSRDRRRADPSLMAVIDERAI